VTIQFNSLLASRWTIAVAVTFAIAGCGGGGGYGGGSSNPPPPPPPPPATSDFQKIQDTIFTPICTTCHSGASAPRGLRLDAGNSFSMIVNVASVEVPALKRIDPGNPDNSYLVQKIQGTAAVGVRMPANGPPFLTQAQIDQVRAWVAAGAPASFAPSNRLSVVSTVPAMAERANAGVGKLTVIFNGDVDSSLVSRETFTLRDGMDQPVELAAVNVPAGRQNVVELTTVRPLAAGSYQLSVHGDGPVALADQAGHVLDGDADGKPGGDALIPFDVSAGEVSKGSAQ